jgi:hypothetical protein
MRLAKTVSERLFSGANSPTGCLSLYCFGACNDYGGYYELIKTGSRKLIIV